MNTWGYPQVAAKGYPRMAPLLDPLLVPKRNPWQEI